MKLSTFIFLLTFSSCLYSNNAEKYFLESVNKALKVNHAAFNVVDRIKFIDTDNFATDTFYVMLKRNGFIPKINCLFRLQYGNGNVNLFTGQEYKSLDVDEKNLFVVDTSQGAFYWIESEGIMQLCQKMLPNPENKLEFSQGYRYEFLDNVLIDGQECRQISIAANLTVPTPEARGYDSNLYPSYDSAVVAISMSDNYIRRFYRYVLLEDGSSQIEEQIISNLTVSLPIDDLMFDISLPEGYSIKEYDADAEQPDLLKNGSAAPKWVLADENGKEYRLSEYKDNVIVMDFWGTWCKWCIKAMPKIQELHEMYSANGLKIFGISCQEPHNADPKKFMESKGFTYQLLVQGDEVAKHYKVKGFPTLYIIDKQGKIVFSMVGYTDNMFDKLSKIIKEELEK